MKDIVQSRLEKYKVFTSEDEENALKEITQEVFLYALYKAGFFSEACFLGGTNLRILHGLERFSEDLDFATLHSVKNFSLVKFLKAAVPFINAYGYDIQVDSKDQFDKNVQSRFIKEDSIKNLLVFKYRQNVKSTIKIKVEIDTNPPSGSKTEVKFVGFPLDFPVLSYDLPTLMAGKIHAILCRKYNKGRDWFDLLWYINNKIKLNKHFLNNALLQFGPWANQDLLWTDEKLKEILQEKIKSVDWKKTQLDVRKFLTPERAESLQFWSEEFFLMKLNQLGFEF